MALIKVRHLLRHLTEAPVATLPKQVKIVEVGPRDGLQHEANALDISTRVEFINRLSKTGLRAIEVGSFVRADRIPQMVDTDQVYQAIQKRPNIDYPVLVPNIQGLESAIAVGVKEIAVFCSASEAFSQKNINCSIDESLERVDVVMLRAKAEGINVRAYLSCIGGCPYQGDVEFESIRKVSEALLSKGCYEISLGDTIGTATPELIANLLDYLSAKLPIGKLALHCHDTYGNAIVNIHAGLLKGISVIDSSVAGLGGCPYAEGASGNVATEAVLKLLDDVGIDSGISLSEIIKIGRFISDKLGVKSDY